MRYGLLADIHGNLSALRAVLEELRHRGAEKWIVAGDIVGYGAYPNECVEAVGELDAASVAGNHDLIALGLLPDESISAPARASLRWTSKRLSESSRRFLAELPLTAVVGDVVVTHGSLDDVTEYVTRPWQARRQLERLHSEHPCARVLVLGHTHRPWAWTRTRGGSRTARTRPVPEHEPLLVNPGAVGQSRELVVRARGALLDLEHSRVDWIAAHYDVPSYRMLLPSVGLPPEGCHYVPSRARVLARGIRRAIAGY
jgi:predicted phosphodiesterase